MHRIVLTGLLMVGCSTKTGSDEELGTDALGVSVSGDDFHASISESDDTGDESGSNNEICDGIDNDGDGQIDEGVLLTFFEDGDADGWGGAEVLACEQPSGAVTEGGDCDDDNAAIHPGAEELCNELDDNCNEAIDEGLDSIFYEDRDDDGYGNPDMPILSCARPDGYAENGDDCDDSAGSVSPEASEVCNAVDDNCDGRTDEGVGTILYPDADGDGYGLRDSGVTACWELSGHSNTPGDCNDDDPAINPDAEEICDDVDNDCDGEIDEHASIGLIEYWADLDGDGHGAGDPWTACEVPYGFASSDDDCDDSDPSRAPSNPEVCNGFDDDCDGSVDEGVLSTYYEDEDGDGFGAGSPVLACTVTDGLSESNLDCDDSRADVYPSAEERCDGVDNDCNVIVDDDAVDGSTFYADLDGDGFGDPASATVSCDTPGGYVDTYTDCDPSRSDVYPGAPEYCDEVDNDCDGAVDDDPVDVGTWYADADGDGFGSADETIEDCSPPPGYLADSSDCNDDDPAVNPDAIESCATLYDDDCDGESNGRDADECIVFHADRDGDGFGDDDDYACLCSPASVWTEPDDGDCNDDDDSINPDADETCDGEDQNCDGTVDEDADDCPCTQYTWSTHSYWFCTSWKKWPQARDYCQHRNYALATINSLEEQTWLIDSMREWWEVPNESYWIGLNDRTEYGGERGGDRSGWTWVSGETYAFQAWSSMYGGQPDNWGNEDCVHMNLWDDMPAAEDWNDARCGDYYYFICEAAP